MAHIYDIVPKAGVTRFSKHMAATSKF